MVLLWDRATNRSQPWWDRSAETNTAAHCELISIDLQSNLVVQTLMSFLRSLELCWSYSAAWLSSAVYIHHYLLLLAPWISGTHQIYGCECLFWSSVPNNILWLTLQARNNYQNGQYALAHSAARDAKRFNMIGIGVGIGILVFVVVLTLISVIIPVIAIAASNRN